WSSSSRPSPGSCARVPCPIGTSSVSPFRVPAVLLTHPEEAPRSEAGELDDAALGAARRAVALAGGLAALLRGLGLFLCHRGRVKKLPGWGAGILPPDRRSVYRRDTAVSSEAGPRAVAGAAP